MKKVLSLVIIALFTTSIFGQISQEGLPLAFEMESLKASIPVISVEKPDVSEEIADDIDRDAFKYPPRDAVIVPVGHNLENSGKWTTIENGDRVWQCAINSPEAVSLELFFEDFYLPIGSKLFVYSENQEQVLGAFTSVNNKPRNRFATDAIYGETAILEYYEPAEVAGLGSMTIMDLAYSYRDLRSSLGGSQHCEVDVACPEGEEWANEINATVRVRTRINGNMFWCTGTLMNNTALDCKPYILTALHCALNGTQSSTADYDLYKFYFRFQTPGCGSGNAPAGFCITGCDLRADSNDGGGTSGSDFMLLELQEDIPESYNPFWAGWTRSSSASSGGGVCIHHPNADSKKISTFSSTPQSSGWGTTNTHWRVFWVETQTNWGVTEGGSSGSAIFNADHHVMGTLTGGASFCEGVSPPNGPDDPDLFGKMQRHFISNPNPASEKLSEWLDPIDLGSITFDGSTNPCGNVSVQEIEAQRVFSVFPNPGNGDFVIEILNEDFKVDGLKVFDSQGKVIRNFVPNTLPIRLNLENEAEGIYVVQVSLEGNRSFNRKLVLTK